MGMISSAFETEALAMQANPEDRAYFVPAFTELGAPYWDAEATGLLTGITRTTGKKEMVKACVESIAYQITDLIEIMREETGDPVETLHVDGGPTGNRYLMQFQSDMADTCVLVPDLQELSGMGAAYLAGISSGLYQEKTIFEHIRTTAYRRRMEEAVRLQKYEGWKIAIRKALLH